MDMRLFGLSLAIAVPLLCLYPAEAPALEEQTSVVKVYATASPEVEEGETAMVTFDVRAGAGCDKVISVAAPGGETKHCRIIKGEPSERVVSYTTTIGDDDPNRGWLGVQLAEVSPALIAHLPSAEGGVVIHNIVEDSPAGRAGLQRYDILTAINGEAVAGGVGGAAKAIGAVGPDSKATLTVLRGGQELQVDVALASRPGGGTIDWVHSFAPEAVTSEVFNTYGRLLAQDENGNWSVEDLGDLSDLAELDSLPEDIRELLPGAQASTIKIMIDDDQATMTTMVVRDGETLTVSQQDNGSIVVTRTDKDGMETTATYTDEDALKAGDPDAFEVFENVSSGLQAHVVFEPGKVVIEPGKTGLLSFDHTMPEFDFDFGEGEDWQEQVREAMEDAREAMEESHRHADEIRKQIKLRVHKIDEQAPTTEAVEETHVSVIDNAVRTFRETPDGQIKVTIRKGENEVTRVFADRADLRKRDPELYGEFAGVLSDE